MFTKLNLCNVGTVTNSTFIARVRNVPILDNCQGIQQTTPFGCANKAWLIDLGWEAKHKRKRIKVKVNYKIYDTESVL